MHAFHCEDTFLLSPQQLHRISCCFKKSPQTWIDRLIKQHAPRIEVHRISSVSTTTLSTLTELTLFQPGYANGLKLFAAQAPDRAVRRCLVQLWHALRTIHSVKLITEGGAAVLETLLPFILFRGVPKRRPLPLFPRVLGTSMVKAAFVKLRPCLEHHIPRDLASLVLDFLNSASDGRDYWWSRHEFAFSDWGNPNEPTRTELGFVKQTAKKT